MLWQHTGIRDDYFFLRFVSLVGFLWLYFSHNIHALHNLSKHNMSIIEPGSLAPTRKAKKVYDQSKNIWPILDKSNSIQQSIGNIFTLSLKSGVNYLDCANEELASISIFTRIRHAQYTWPSVSHWKEKIFSCCVCIV